MTGTPTHQPAAISRPLVGGITLVLLLTWVVLGVLQWTGTLDRESARLQMWWAGFGRVGLLMFALWLALPSKNRPAAWANISKPMLAFGLLLVVLIAIRPWIAIPLLVLLALASIFLRPRERRRPQSRAG